MDGPDGRRLGLLDGGTSLPATNGEMSARNWSKSNANERHAVVILPGFTQATFDVANLLMDDGAPLPSIDPDLPAAVTHVWPMSTWSSGLGMRWSPAEEWTYIDKLLTTADS
jgi:hypothetical protein